MHSLVVAERLSLATVTGTLIADASFSVEPGSRIALVGRNGSGKSTLLDLVYARARGLPPAEHVRTEGRLTVRAGVRAGVLPQAPPPLRVTAGAYLDNCSSGAARVYDAYVRALDAVAGDPAPAALDAYAQALDAMTVNDAWDHPSRRAAILGDLVAGVDPGRPLASLSGGETTKVALAGLLLGNPELLLLDEPTNNLDASALAFLGRWLEESAAAMIVVSHDREFLDAVVGQIVAIDEHAHDVRVYGGNYSAWAAQRAVEFEARQRQFEEQQRAVRRLTEDARRLDRVAGSFERTQNDYMRARGKKVARRAVVQRSRIERDLARLEEPQPPRQPRIVVPPLERSADDTVIALRDAGIGVAGRILLDAVSLRIGGVDRVAIMGPNGSGKTTLLRVIAGEAPVAGTVVRGRGVRIAVLHQLPLPPRRGETTIDYARRVAPVSEDEAGALLGKVTFADISRRPVSAFSVGERRRIELAVLFASRPHLVLLDEPTNHLDLPSIEMLEDALDEFGGAVVAISHDRRFLARLGPARFFEISGRRLAAQPAPLRDTAANVRR